MGEDDILAAFEVLCQEYYGKVYQTVYFFTRDKFVTEDAVQQAFVIAFQKINDLKSQDKFSSWVTAIALNGAKHLLKAKSEAKVIPLNDTLPANYNESFPDVETRADVRHVLRALKPQDAEILLLKYFADLTLEQIASVKNVTQATVKMRLHRARESYRRAILLDTTKHDIGGERQ